MIGNSEKGRSKAQKKKEKKKKREEEQEKRRGKERWDTRRI